MSIGSLVDRCKDSPISPKWSDMKLSAMEFQTLQNAADVAEAQQELLKFIKYRSKRAKRNSPLITLLAAALKRVKMSSPAQNSL